MYATSSFTTFVTQVFDNILVEVLEATECLANSNFLTFSHYSFRELSIIIFPFTKMTELIKQLQKDARLKTSATKERFNAST